jgi:hypothetical protein
MVGLYDCLILLFCKITIKYVGPTWITRPHMSPTNFVKWDDQRTLAYLLINVGNISLKEINIANYTIINVNRTTYLL